MYLRFQSTAQNVRELDQHGSRRIRIKSDQGGDSVQRIEKKVGIDLADQRVHACLEQRFFLVDQFALNPRGVPDADTGSATPITVARTIKMLVQRMRRTRINERAVGDRPHHQHAERFEHRADQSK